MGEKMSRTRDLEAKNAELEKKLVEAEKAFEDKKRALNAAINMWDIETKKLEIAVACLCRVENATDWYAVQQENKLINDLVNEALVAIKEKEV